MITFVRGDDWIGCYRDGKLVAQQHSFDLHSLRELLGVEFDIVWCSSKWLYERGWLPEKLEDVKMEDS